MISNEVRELGRHVRAARRQGWRLAEGQAKEFGEAALKAGAIDIERLPKFIRKLEHGELFLRDDGQWACTTCGGNCGQCGDTGFLGNIGFSFDHLVNTDAGRAFQHIQREAERRAITRQWLRAGFRSFVYFCIWVIYLAVITYGSWQVAKWIYG